jgi:hypothetical protein
MDADD